MDPSISLVVATYGESVDWVPPLGLTTFIYDATASRPGMIHVPNQAREAGQYLRHIVAHYGRFQDWQIFLQGDPFPHCPDLAVVLATRSFVGRHYFPLGRELGLDLTSRHPHSLATAEFCHHAFGRTPPWVRWTPGAQFAASRQSLMAWPLGFWQRLLDLALTKPDASPWAMERLWGWLLNPP